MQELRTRYKDKFEKANGVKLGFSSFFVKAAVEALKRYPVVNAAVDGSDIVYREFYDVGMAVSTDRGLVVPVLRDAGCTELCAGGRRPWAISPPARAMASSPWTISLAAPSASPMVACSVRCFPRPS